MSKIEIWKDERAAGFVINGLISDRDLLLHPREIIADVKRQIVAAIVDKIMEDFGPKLDVALTEAFRERSKANVTT